MPLHENIAGVWTGVSLPQVNVSGAWYVASMYEKVGIDWQLVHNGFAIVDYNASTPGSGPFAFKTNNISTADANGYILLITAKRASSPITSVVFLSGTAFPNLITSAHDGVFAGSGNGHIQWTGAPAHGASMVIRVTRGAPFSDVTDITITYP